MRVLVALDGSESSESVAKTIAPWAAAAHADLHLVTVIHPDSVRGTARPQGFTHSLTPEGTTSGQLVQSHEPYPTAAEDRTQAIARVESERGDYLNGVAARWFAGQTVSVHVVADENTAAAICREAARLAVDIIAMATRGRHGFAGALFGNIHEHVVRDSPVPVLLVGPAAQA